nr:MAG TPA: hypothetical protein [Caudoviricetes sp.]
MSIDEMRKAMQEFCREVRCHCHSCPVVVVHGLCEKYDWPDAPDDLVKKAYLLAFGKIKEDEQMNITADDICKAALELIGEMAQAADDNGKQLAIGYILGVGDLTKKVTEGEEND